MADCEDQIYLLNRLSVVQFDNNLVVDRYKTVTLLSVEFKRI